MKSLIQSTHAICSLPTTPIHNWATQASNAFSLLGQHIISSILIVKMNDQLTSFEPLSTGCTISNTESQSSENRGFAYSSQTLNYIDKLERLNTFGFNISQEAFQRGLVASLSSLSNDWKNSPINDVFNAQNIPFGLTKTSPILTLVPITMDQKRVLLISIIAQDPMRTTHSSPLNPHQLIEAITHLHPIISLRAQAALSKVADPKAWLTDRENQILDLLIRGHSVRIIAEHLNRSTHTVHDHVKNLHKKLNATSRGQLIAIALGHSEHTQCAPAPTQPITIKPNSTTTELKPDKILAKPLTR